MIILQRGVPFVKGHLMGFPSFTSAIFSPARSKLVARRTLTSDSSYDTLAEGKEGASPHEMRISGWGLRIEKATNLPGRGLQKSVMIKIASLRILGPMIIRRGKRRKCCKIHVGGNMIHLFQAWGEVERKIRQASLLFLLLDYDGTLTPIVARPELAVCPPGVKSLLEKLRDSSRSQVAIISGRALEDLKKKVRVSGITYVGNHGLEMENPAGVHRKKLSPQRQEELGRIGKDLEARLNRIPGIAFEDKGPILAVHHRNAPRESGRFVQTAVEGALAGYPNRWQISTGKKVFEIRPQIEFGKGKTVRELLNRSSGTRPFPVYLGDDRSDEEAFVAIRGQGIPIFVGPEPASSAASFFLRDPSEVLDFLGRCKEILRK